MSNKITKLDVIKYFGEKRHMLCKFVIPVSFIRKIEHIYITVFRNSCEFPAIFNFFFYFGLNIFYDLLIDGKIKSFMEMLRIAKYIQSSSKEFIINAEKDAPLIPLDDYPFIISLMKKAGFKKSSQFAQFLLFVKNERNMYIDEKIILHRADIVLLLKKWLHRNKD